MSGSDAGPTNSGVDNDAALVMRDVCHHYVAGTPVLRNLNVAVSRGEIACLLGSSGCGKTTALRIVAGFEAVSAGEVYLAGQMVGRAGFALPPEKRGVGMVFQDAALFPHKTIADNVGFGLQRFDRERRRARVRELLVMVDLEAHARKWPHQLSGGQRQRAALARAMAPEPGLILLDEPFSALDSDLRRKLSRDVRALLKANGMTAVLVTHDQQEAFAMADRIALMHQGRLEQYGDARSLYDRPASRVVAGFIGEGVFLPMRREGDLLRGPAGEWPAPAARELEGELEVLVRPDEWSLVAESDVVGSVLDVDYRGTGSLYRVRLAAYQGWPEQEIEVYFKETLRVGEEVRLRLTTPPTRIFAKQTEATPK